MRIRPSPRCSCRPNSADVGRSSRHAAGARPTSREVWAAHFAVVEGERSATRNRDRSRPLPRPRPRRRHAVAAIDGRRCRTPSGTVLDPIFALRRRVRSRPGIARVAFWTVVASSRDELLDLIDKHHDRNAFDRAKTLAWTQAQVQLRHLDIEADEARHFQRLAGHILYADPALRASSDTIRRGRRRNRPCGRTPFPATCRSCCCASTTSRISPWSASCCAPTNIGA